MADLSDEHRHIITQNPLPLSPFQQPFSLNSADDNDDSRQAIADLLKIFKEHPLAHSLSLPKSSTLLASKLTTILDQMEQDKGNTFTYDRYYELLDHVVKKVPDVEIWRIVLNLVADTTLRSPPFTPRHQATKLISSLKQTPHSYSASRLENTSELERDVDAVLQQELKSSLRLDVPDFVSAIFGHVSRLEKLAKTALDSCHEGDDIRYTQTAGWTGWPKDCQERKVVEWFKNIMPGLITSIQREPGYVAHCRRIYAKPQKYLHGAPTQRKMDIGIERVDGSSEDPPHWDRILVVGELKSKPAEDGHEETFLDLAKYAREVFRTQDRRYVLGFSLCGSIMRLWQFDHSGSSGSTPFDINEDGDRFVRVMLGYHLMNDEQLGFDSTIHRVDGQRCIDITRNGQIERLFLEKEVRKHAGIIGRATTCWKAYRGAGASITRLVIKDSWQYEERPEEGELIRDATSQSVINIAQYYHHETVQCANKDDDIFGNVRKGMMKECARRNFRQRFNPQTSASEYQKKIASSQTKSGSNSRKRSSSSLTTSSHNKRSRTSNLTSPTEPSQHNRIHRRVVTSSPGKPLSEASSCAAIMTAFIGAITGHQSLLGAGILHRDISIGNIMLTETEDEGFLIDLDLAIRIKDQQPSGAPSRTGTKVFMAVGALMNEPHTFMQDLESFFWVFLWICVHFRNLNTEGKREYQETADYEKWNYKTPRDLALTQGGVILFFTKVIEDDITEYSRPLVPCLKQLHQVVFPDRQVRQKEDHNLYSEMIQVFEKARNDLK